MSSNQFSPSSASGGVSGRPSNNLIGIGLALLSALLLTINGAIGKELGGELHPFFLNFIRAFVMVMMLLPWILRRGISGIRTTRPVLQFTNGLFFMLALSAWFWALPRIPLDLNTAVGFTAQTFAVLGAIFFLGEKSEPWRWGALVVGIIGALIIVRPGAGEISPGVLAMLFSSLCFAVTKLLVKIITRTDPPESVVFWQAAWVAILAFPIALFYWTVPNIEQMIWIVALAIVTIMNHFCITWAISLADIAVIEPISFTRLIWAAILGYIFFGDIPNAFTLTGGVIVLASVVYIARRERQERKSAPVS
ncbi:MAG: DMT family transporter [Rhodospirillaceae bacterium]|jgi:drug/metabolite transporter (DMT)-like permease|nr:DMT family transporter [Rhodospirillaceae bacterium]MBT4588540.1 DMT family transporter [Rhodospirillaceae bacterium]MBT4938669.1 DMT family transporter [Rhodospirillaceae bacterium]MBT7265954.1 DMT family transporter [Rhodospirillaceae bacterium]